MDSRGAEPSFEGENERQFATTTATAAKHRAAVMAIAARLSRCGARGLALGGKVSIGYIADGGSGRAAAVTGPPLPLPGVDIEAAVKPSARITGGTKR